MELHGTERFGENCSFLIEVGADVSAIIKRRDSKKVILK